MTSKASVAIRYTAIATSASIFNLLLQVLILKIYSGVLATELSIMLATGIILPIKYAAEKKFVFNFKTKSVSHDINRFTLYTFVSILTVFIFWGTELVFHYTFHNEKIKYLGGAIGLAVSFYVKYIIDKNFVFIHRNG